MPTFDRCLSLRVDAIHAELERIQDMRNTPRKIVKLLWLRLRLRRLTRRIPA
jgi:hypothetical protein